MKTKEIDMVDKINDIKNEIYGLADLMCMCEEHGMQYPRVFVFLDGAITRLADALAALLDDEEDQDEDDDDEEEY